MPFVVVQVSGPHLVVAPILEFAKKWTIAQIWATHILIQNISEAQMKLNHFWLDRTIFNSTKLKNIKKFRLLLKEYLKIIIYLIIVIVLLLKKNKLK